MSTAIKHAETAIAEALDAIRTAYWQACAAEGRAIDPEDLGMSETEAELLAEEFGTAQDIEEHAALHGVNWEEAKGYFL